ncbi:Hypothetical_protein [Hexamita inflata]|uniref:Hypothetical_protein n=1 Tax=Hexamita inflata TaxID=28002 RepID=A0AA86R5Q8_9EUKA|nr:Hypothetical protein HINF_LOCUS57507 [Hexamita inflata]
MKKSENTITNENKYKILQNKQRYQNQPCVQHVKQSHNKIYIKIILSDGNQDIKLKIINRQTQENRISYGDYYELTVDQEYCICSLLEVGEVFQLIFSENVIYDIIPDFPYQIDKSANIQILMRGKYFPVNQYYFDNNSCSEDVEVATALTIRLLNTPISVHNETDFKPLAYIMRHEPLNIRQLYGDYGFTTYKGIDGWVCIRYVTKLGYEGSCNCIQCLNNRLNVLPLQLCQPKQLLRKNIAINDLILRQMYNQYMNCQCSHCLQVKTGQELYVDPEIDLITKFYQKFSRCINYEQICISLNDLFPEEQFTVTQIQKMFLQKIFPKIQKRVSKQMMDDLQIIAKQLYPDQFQIAKNILVQEMNTNMKDYDIQNVKDNLKNWISRNKNIQSKRLTDSEICLRFKILINKYYSELDTIKKMQHIYKEQFNSYCQNQNSLDVQLLTQILESETHKCLNYQQTTKDETTDNQNLILKMSTIINSIKE